MIKDVQRKVRIDYLDLIKAIAIIFVIFYHFNILQINVLQDSSLNTLFGFYISSLLSTCVPLFFFVNGALLLNKTSLNIGTHIKKILRIIFLTVAWGVLTILFLSYLREVDIGILKTLWYVYEIKTGWIDHLWYLEALIVLYIFLPLIFNTYQNNTKHFNFFLAAVMVLTFGNQLLGMVATTFSFFTNKLYHANLHINFFSEFNAFRSIYGFAFGYFMLGGILINYQEKLKTQGFQILALIAIPLSMLLLTSYGLIASRRSGELWDVVWYGYDTIFTLINVIAIFILCLHYKNTGYLGSFIKLIGENSLGIYFIHIFTGNLLAPLLPDSTHSLLLNLLFGTAILLSSLLTVLGLKKLPVVRELFVI